MARTAVEVRVIEGDEQDEIGRSVRRDRPAVVHVDSGHRHAPTEGLTGIATALDVDTVVCLEDIRWSRGMERIWREITTGRFGTAAAVDLGLWGVLVVAARGIEGCPPPVHRVAAPRGLCGGRTAGGGRPTDR